MRDVNQRCCLRIRRRRKRRKLLIIVIAFTHIFLTANKQFFLETRSSFPLKQQWILISGYYITFVEFKIHEMCFQGRQSFIDINLMLKDKQLVWVEKEKFMKARKLFTMQALKEQQSVTLKNVNIHDLNLILTEPYKLCCLVTHKS